MERMKHDKTRKYINLELKLGAKRDMGNIWESLLSSNVENVQEMLPRKSKSWDCQRDGDAL